MLSLRLAPSPKEMCEANKLISGNQKKGEIKIQNKHLRQIFFHQNEVGQCYLFFFAVKQVVLNTTYQRKQIGREKLLLLCIA